MARPVRISFAEDARLKISGHCNRFDPQPMRNRLPAAVLLAIAFTFSAAAAGHFLIFQNIPHINDEAAYMFQARLFASGRLYVSSPCAREFFDFPHMINNGRWLSQYPPGYPLLLSLGVAAGAPWLVNPILAALSILILYLLGRRLFDRATGILASILGAVSIWVLLMSASYMAHPAALCFTALSFLFLLRSSEAPTFGRGLAAGAILGFTALIKPYSAFFLFLPLLIWYLIRSLRRRDAWINLVGLASGLAFFGAVFLLYNWGTTGRPLEFGYFVTFGREVLPGFGHAPRFIIPNDGVRQNPCHESLSSRPGLRMSATILCNKTIDST